MLDSVAKVFALGGVKSVKSGEGVGFMYCYSVALYQYTTVQYTVYVGCWIICLG